MQPREERHEIYKKAKEKLTGYYGICFSLSLVINNGKQRICLRDFPEIESQTPVEVDEDGYWFPLDLKGLSQREEVLRKAIYETQNKLL